MSANRRFLKYGIKGRTTWYIAHCPYFIHAIIIVLNGVNATCRVYNNIILCGEKIIIWDRSENLVSQARRIFLPSKPGLLPPPRAPYDFE